MSDFRVLVCGDREWNDPQPIVVALRDLLAEHGRLTVIEGAARGADSLAGYWAERAARHSRPVHHLSYPALWNEYGRKAGPIRNQLMLTDGKPDLVLAFHDNLDASKGTAHMVKIARKAGVEVRVISHEVTS